MPFRISCSRRRLPPRRGLSRGSGLPLLGVVLSLIPSGAAGQTFEAVGTRAQGMAGAFVAVADDASAVYWNPAGLATGAMVDLQWDSQSRQRVAHSERPLGAGESVSRGTSRLVALGVPALGLFYYRLHDSLAAADPTTVGAAGGRESESGGGLSLDGLTTHNFGVSVVQSVADWAVIGATVRVVRGMAVHGTGSEAGLPDGLLDAADALEGPGRTTFDVDAGAMASFGVVRVGIMARNLRKPEIRVAGAGSGGVTLQRQLRAGIAIAPRSRPTGIHGPYTLSLDLDLRGGDGPEGERRHVAAGFERWWVGGRFGARAGVRVSTREPRRPVAAAGFSVGLSHSAFVDGQLTGGHVESERSWGIATRVTF
jgi:hypothetical protein